MEGFAGFVGLMFGLVVLSVIITLVVCAVKRHRRECFRTDSVESDFVL